MWSTIKFKLMAGNALLYIKKELNVRTRIFPRSSFRSVPFVKKGIVTVSFSSFESFLNAWGLWQGVLLPDKKNCYSGHTLFLLHTLHWTLFIWNFDVQKTIQ